MMDTITLTVQDSIAQLTFDMPGEKVNKLSTPVMQELNTHLDALGVRGDIRALVFQSAKDSIFIAGADINEIADINSREDAMAKASMGQDIMNKIEDLPYPTFAFVNGAAMGGGLELALACDMRIAGIGKKTKLALPETQLGIIPGFGGTYRLPRVVGLVQAAKMILSGSPVNAEKAAKIKLVDAAYPQEFVQEWGMRLVRQTIAQPGGTVRIKKNRAKKKFPQKLAEDFFFGRIMVIKALKKNTDQKTKGRYPALSAAIRVLRKTAGVSRTRALKTEVEEFADIASSSVCKNLVALFFAQEKAKKQHRVPSNEAVSLRSAAVLGAGVMGGKIAWLFSKKGIPVVMKDVQWVAVQKGYQEAKGVYDTLVKIKKASGRDVYLGMNRISGAVDYAALGSPSLVIEAVVEKMEIKKQVLAEIEAYVDADTIIASNTSALSIDELALALKKPERFCGMHFFNPAHRMPLVEIIAGKYASQTSIARTVQAAKTLGKTPIVVKSCPGFLVNRLLMPYINEAVKLCEEKNSIHDIDVAFKDWGMPMGPLRLLDEIGIDVGYEVAETLNDAYGERMSTGMLFSKLKAQDDMHAGSALLGKKSGAGFYVYEKKVHVNPRMRALSADIATKKSGSKASHEDILHRPLLTMLNEAARALEENVVKSSWELDLALIMGTGFPPFRGGLLRWADSLGADTILTRLNRFRDLHGMRFEPAPLIAQLAQEESSFYKAYPGE